MVSLPEQLWHRHLQRFVYLSLWYLQPVLQSSCCRIWRGRLLLVRLTLFIVPVLYDIIYRKKDMKKVDIGDEESLKDDEVLLAEGINDIGGNVDSE